VLDVARGSSLKPLLWAAGALAAGLVVVAAVSTPWVALDVPPAADGSVGVGADVVGEDGSSGVDDSGAVGADGSGRFAPDPDLDFTAAEQARAEEYRAAVRPPAYLALGLGLAATVLVGLTPVGVRLMRRLPIPSRGPAVLATLVPAAVGGLVLLLGFRVLTLPLSAWQESVRRDVGLSTRDWGDWWLDVGRGFGVQTALTLVGVLAIVLLARRWPRRWWAVAAPGAAGLVIVASLAYPLVVEPLFNRFEPLADDDLRTSLVELAEREGITVGDVLVADASRRTTAFNAYVSGLGPTKRVVLYDTLLETAPRDEIEVVVAHELAHARENDVLTGTLLGAGGAALAVLLVALAGSWQPLAARAGLVADTLTAGLPADTMTAGLPTDPSRVGLVDAHGGRGESTGESGAVLGQAAAVPFLLALVTLVGFVAGPAQALISRQIEARADAVALDLTGNPETFVRMQHTLAVTALSDVDPPRLLHWWFSSHPTAPERIAMARTWAALNDHPIPPPLTSD
jgi:STE24 endopeptidase